MRSNLKGSRAHRKVAVLVGSALVTLGAFGVAPAIAGADDSLCGEVTASGDAILFSLSSDRIDADPLDGQLLSKSQKPFIFLSTSATSDTEVRFWLDDIDDGIVDCSLNPRIDRSPGTIPDGGGSVAYDFFGGNARKATGFSLSQLDPGTYTITTERITGTTSVWSVATFTVGE